MRMAVRQSERRARSSALLKAVMKGAFSQVAVQVVSVGQLHGYSIITFVIFFFFFDYFRNVTVRAQHLKAKKANHNHEIENGRVCCIEYL